jgi:hypothetical protein
LKGKGLLLKTPAEWEAWCDSVWKKRKHHPTFYELVTAIQADALGKPRLAKAILERKTILWGPPAAPTKRRKRG